MNATSSSLFDASPIPRYLQLADVLRGRITRGEWRQGDILPSLETLMAQFDVSRVTVRQAVSLLAQEGALSPQRGRGTFVTAKAGPNRKLHLQTTLKDLVEMYRGDKPELLTFLETTAIPLIDESDGRPAAKYFCMKRVHSRDGERYCAITIYIDNRIFRRAPTRFRREVVLPILVSLPGVRIAKTRQTLTISSADAETARLIGIPVNAPVANVRRVFNDPDGTVIYLAEVTYRGDYIHLEMDLTP